MYFCFPMYYLCTTPNMLPYPLQLYLISLKEKKIVPGVRWLTGEQIHCQSESLLTCTFSPRIHISPFCLHPASKQFVELFTLLLNSCRRNPKPRSGNTPNASLHRDGFLYAAKGFKAARTQNKTLVHWYITLRRVFIREMADTMPPPRPLSQLGEMCN